MMFFFHPGYGTFCEAPAGQGAAWQGARPHRWTDDEAGGGEYQHIHHDSGGDYHEHHDDGDHNPLE